MQDSTHSRPQAARRPAWQATVLTAAAYAALAVLFLGSSSRWTWQIDSRHDRLSLGAGFDSLADHLLHAQALVDPHYLRGEAIQTPRGVVMYFGIFPALLRVFADALWPSMWGRWTTISTVAACLIAVGGLARGARIALAANPGLTARHRAVLRWVWFCALGLGSPVLHLVGAPNIYFESIAWGFAGSMVALSFLAGALLAGDLRPRTLFGLAAGACVATLARPTYGGPLWLVAALALVIALRRRPAAHPWRVVLAVAAPFVLTLAVQGWYNAARWGSPTVFLDLTGYAQRDRWAFVLEQGQWNVHRLTTGFYNYFTVSNGQFVARPPFVRLVLPEYRDAAYSPEFRQGILSVPVSAPLLLPAAAAGIVLAMTRRSGRLVPLAATALLGSQVVLICGFYHLAHRYTLEIYPTLVFASLCFLALVPAAWLSRATAVVGVVLLALSVSVNALAQVYWLVHVSPQTPPALRESLQRAFPGE